MLSSSNDRRADTDRPAILFKSGRLRTIRSKPLATEAETIAMRANTHPAVTSKPAPLGAPLIAELSIAFLVWGAEHFKSPATGKPTAELGCFKSVLKPLRENFGTLPADEFDSAKLIEFRERLIELGWTRGYINRSISRVLRMFRWGVPRKLVRAATLAELSCVGGLEVGRSAARDTPGRKAVPLVRLEAVRGRLSEHFRDVFDLLLLTGARPGEVFSITGAMIEQTGDVWRCSMQHHKTSHLGKERLLYFNAAAQTILKRRMREDGDLSLRIFPYTRDHFGDAVRQACQAAFDCPKELLKPRKELTGEELVRLLKWKTDNAFVPHQLRHTVATKLVDAVGLDATQRLLGHSTAAMTAHYSKAAEGQAIEAVKKLG